MEPAAPSPFLEVPEAEWVCANDLCFAIFDSYPVSPGHVLVITRRVVPTFFECTAAEQQALMALVGEVKALLDERLERKPDGYNVGFNAGAAAGQTVPHVHVHEPIEKSLGRELREHRLKLGLALGGDNCKPRPHRIGAVGIASDTAHTTLSR